MLDKARELTIAYDADINLVASISPCSWMYPNYGLQIQIRIESTGGTAYILNRSLPFAQATEDDVRAMVASVRIVHCPRCQSPAFDPATVETNRSGLCEACSLKDLSAKYDAAKKKEAAKLARTDASMKLKGMTHRVDAWVHPSGGDDDYQISLYVSEKPTKAMIRTELRRCNSSVLDDCVVFPL